MMGPLIVAYASARYFGEVMMELMSFLQAGSAGVVPVASNMDADAYRRRAQPGAPLQAHITPWSHFLDEEIRLEELGA